MLFKNKTKQSDMVSIPMVVMREDSDYIWQYRCLKDRINNPEKYAGYPNFENVEERIAHLLQWIYEYEKTHPKYKTLRLSGYYEKFVH